MKTRVSVNKRVSKNNFYTPALEPKKKRGHCTVTQLSTGIPIVYFRETLIILGSSDGQKWNVDQLV